MPETNTATTRVRRIRHTGRGRQVGIYLGKQIRFFINQNDWKVLPMAAIIAGLVGMVIRKRFFVNMEGSLIGAFALTCVGIWNGCFNSIQSVCRERAIIKREHRSGMHISSYVAAHMIYQFFLCTAQTALTMFVLRQLGVPIPVEGFLTPWMMVDLGITMLLITYAADMMSLFLSSIARTTTGAMTLMPFILIFQLVFSGGIIPLPEWSRPLSNFTISNYGIRALAAQSNYNDMPMTTVWNTVEGMKDNEIGGTFTVGQVMDALDSPGFAKYRDTVILKTYTVGEAAEIIKGADAYLHLSEKEVLHTFTLRQLAEEILNNDDLKEIREYKIISVPGKADITVEKILRFLTESKEMTGIMDKTLGQTVTLGQLLESIHLEDLVKETSDVKLNKPVTVGQVIDFLKNNDALQKKRDLSFTVKTTVGDLMDLVGEEKVKDFVQKKTAAAAYKEEYETSKPNIVANWILLFAFIAFFALAATIALELIDKDKR